MKLDAIGEFTLEQNATSAPADLNPDGGQFIMVDNNDNFENSMAMKLDAIGEFTLEQNATSALADLNPDGGQFIMVDNTDNLEWPTFYPPLIEAEWLCVNNMASSNPAHWVGPSLAQDCRQGFSAHLLDEKSKTLAVIKKMFQVKSPSDLGKGYDAQKDTLPYNDLEVHCAWRIENPDLWARYVAERKFIDRQCDVLRANGAELHMPLHTELSEDAGALPDYLMQEVSEVRLLHGTKPESVLALLNSGLNDRLSNSSGMFNAGVYVAERPEKADQYARPDSKYNAAGLEDLHAHLFRAGGAAHPDDDIFYCFVVRACLGAPLDTKGLKPGSGVSKMVDCETNEAVYKTTDRRELVLHPASLKSNPISYHSLVVGKGKALKRFREFILYTDKRVYIEYLIAYRRIKA